MPAPGSDHMYRNTIVEQQRQDFMSKPPECTLIPVHATDRCAGHLRHTHRGFVAYDCNDKPIGIFTNTDDGATALLALATNGDTNE